jgi:hypothetical protein
LAERWSRGELGDEEYSNIVGVKCDASEITFSPICCNVFDIHEAKKNRRPIVHRVYHSGYEKSYTDQDVAMFKEIFKKRYRNFIE